MSLFDSFKYGNDLAELLVESGNPHALRPLSTSDIDLVRDHLEPMESIQGYAIGRVVGRGRGVWYLSSSAVLLAGDRPFAPLLRVPLADIECVECVAGKYGHTLRLHTVERSHAIYGASPVLALALIRLLGRHARVLPAEGGDALAPQEAMLAAHWFRDAACRIHPAYPAGPAGAEAAARLVDEALAQGLLHPAETEAARAHMAALA